MSDSVEANLEHMASRHSFFVRAFSFFRFPLIFFPWAQATLERMASWREFFGLVPFSYVLNMFFHIFLVWAAFVH